MNHQPHDSRPPRPTFRVMDVIARLNIGGPARHAAVLDDRLRAKGFDTLLVYGLPAAGEGSLEELVIDRRLRAVRISTLGRRIQPWDDVRAFVALLRLLFRERPDVLHTHTAKAGTLGRIAALVYNAVQPRARRCVTVHTFHGHVFSGYFGRLTTRAILFVERLLARRTDRIVTLSPLQRDAIAAFLGMRGSDRIRVVRLGLELDELFTLSSGGVDAKRSFGFEPSDLVFGYVGRLVPVKALHTLIAAFAMAAKEQPNLRLLIIGDGELRASLERLCAESGVASWVRFAGWSLDLPTAYSAMDVAVLSSINEGTPVALIEAMAAGIPVVATDVGGVPDVVERDRTGLLVTAGDPGRMAAAMLRLARDGSLRDELGARGRERVRERFTAARLIDDMDALYREALATKRRG